MFILGKDVESPFTRERQRVTHLEKWIERGPGVVDPRSAIKIIDHIGTFPSESHIAGQSALGQRYRDADRSTNLLAFLTGNLLEDVQLARHPVVLKGPFGTCKIGDLSQVHSGPAR